MRQCGAPDIRTFSIGFEDSQFDESMHASVVATALGTTHTSATVTGGDALELLGVLANFDEPFGDASAIPTYFVSRLARETVTVALSGDGGDELFAGYDRYRRLRRYSPWDSVPLAIRRMSSRVGASLVREEQRGGGFVRRLGTPGDLRFLSLVSRSPHGLVWGALSEDLREFIASDSEAVWQDDFRLQTGIEDARFIDQERFLIDDVMVKVDRASMAVSLEAREPLLDHRLAEYVNALPLRFHHNGDVGKLFLRDFLAGVVPPSIMSRPKMGFSPPVRRWLLGPLRRRTQGVFSDLCPTAFDASGVRRLWEAMELNRRGFDLAVWNLLCLAAWIENQPEESRPL
jgi:asparagine synthase (glutamine-hydrolysing)